MLDWAPERGSDKSTQQYRGRTWAGPTCLVGRSWKSLGTSGVCFGLALVEGSQGSVPWGHFLARVGGEGLYPEVADITASEVVKSRRPSVLDHWSTTVRTETHPERPDLFWVDLSQGHGCHPTL